MCVCVCVCVRVCEKTYMCIYVCVGVKKIHTQNITNLLSWLFKPIFLSFHDEEPSNDVDLTRCGRRGPPPPVTEGCAHAWHLSPWTLTSEGTSTAPVHGTAGSTEACCTAALRMLHTHISSLF